MLVAVAWLHQVDLVPVVLHGDAFDLGVGVQTIVLSVVVAGWIWGLALPLNAGLTWAFGLATVPCLTDGIVAALDVFLRWGVDREIGERSLFLPDELRPERSGAAMLAGALWTAGYSRSFSRPCPTSGSRCSTPRSRVHPAALRCGPSRGRTSSKARAGLAHGLRPWRIHPGVRCAGAIAAMDRARITDRCGGHAWAVCRGGRSLRRHARKRFPHIRSCSSSAVGRGCGFHRVLSHHDRSARRLRKTAHARGFLCTCSRLGCADGGGARCRRVRAPSRQLRAHARVAHAPRGTGTPRLWRGAGDCPGGPALGLRPKFYAHGIRRRSGLSASPHRQRAATLAIL